jgi:nucleotide-binding universal stress UspA family protein
VYQRILLALDDSPAARRACDHAVALAQAFNARLGIITVVPRVSERVATAGVSPAELQGTVEAEGRRILEAALERLPQDVVPTTILAVGSAGHEIVRHAASGRYELIVMGSRGRGRLAEAVLGSVAASVHFHTDAALMIVHPHREGDAQGA